MGVVALEFMHSGTRPLRPHRHILQVGERETRREGEGALMAYEIPTAAEIYAHEHADGWVYDEQGYCPFTRARLETGLRLAFEAGAATVKAEEKPQTHIDPSLRKSGPHSFTPSAEGYRSEDLLRCAHCDQLFDVPDHQKAGK